MPFIPVRDLTVYYEMAGTGPRLLYISGTGGDLRRKPNVFDGPLPDHFTVLAYDQRGLGQTSRPGVAYTMADYAADAEALLGVVGWERCRVMGVSFGGMVAQEFAVTYPQRVERLVLACTSSGGAGGASFPLHTLMEGSAEEQARIMLGLADTRRDAAWQAQHPDQAQELINLSLHAEQPGATEPGRQDGLRRQLAARAGHDVFDRLPRLTMPVFVCGGRYDGLAPPANLAAIQGQIAGSQLALFEGGHGFLQEDPAAYAAVIDFLQAP